MHYCRAQQPATHLERGPSEVHEHGLCLRRGRRKRSQEPFQPPRPLLGLAFFCTSTINAPSSGRVTSSAVFIYSRGGPGVDRPKGGHPPRVRRLRSGVQRLQDGVACQGSRGNLRGNGEVWVWSKRPVDSGRDE